MFVFVYWSAIIHFERIFNFFILETPNKEKLIKNDDDKKIDAKFEILIDETMMKQRVLL